MEFKYQDDEPDYEDELNDDQLDDQLDDVDFDYENDDDDYCWPYGWKQINCQLRRNLYSVKNYCAKN